MTCPSSSGSKSRSSSTSDGFDPGGTDGRFGARTYEAILGFQHKAGVKLDGTPTVALLERLRQGG